MWAQLPPGESFPKAKAAAEKALLLRKHIEVLQEDSKRGYVSPYFIAIDYGLLVDKEREFEWLEKAYKERSSWLVELRVDPLWDFVRSDARYTDLLRRIGY